MSKDNEGLEVEVGVTVKKLAQQMAQAEARMVKGVKKIERQWETSNTRAAGTFRKVDAAIARTKNRISGLQRILIGAVSVREIKNYADGWTVAGNKIAAAGVIANRAGRDLAGINDIADKTRSGFGQTADLYAKYLRATKDVAKNEREVALATELTNKAFKAGGAEASEQAAGILQLSQGLQSGFLQGDELRSIRENAPLIAQAIADEFNTTIGQLKALGADGQLTSERVFRAILKGQTKIEAAFSQTNSTIGEGFTRLRNALTEYIGVGDDSIGATAKIGSALVALADNIDLVIAAGGVLAGVTFGPAMINALVKTTTLIAGATAGLRGLSVGARVTAASIGAVRGAIALLGGPIGAVIAGLSVLPLIIESTDERIEALDGASGDAASALDEYANASQRAADEQDALAGKVSQATSAILKQSRAGLQDSLRTLKSEFKKTVESLGGEDILPTIGRLRFTGKNEARVSDGRRGGLLEDVATQLEGVNNGNASLAETSALIDGIMGVSIEAVEQIEAFDAALTAARPDWVEESRASLRSYAEAAGIFAKQIASIDAAKGATEASAAWLILRDRIAETEQVSRILGQNDAMVKLLRKAGLAEAQIERVNGALTGTNSEIQTANDATNALSVAAGGISFDGAAASASSLADQLQRAVNNAIKLSSQGVDGLERAKINYQYRNDPGGRAGALAGAAYDAKVGATGAMPDGARRYLEAGKAAHVSNAIEAESYRQATIAANKSNSGGGGRAKGGGGSHKTDMFDASEKQVLRLNQQIEMIGKTDREIASLTAKYKLLDEAKKRGLDLDARQTASGKTLREEIDAQADSIGRLTEKADQYAEQASFMEGLNQDLKDGFIDAIIEGENFGDVLGNVAKQLAKAALQAALFGNGSGGGGSTSGGLFSGLFGGGGGLLGKLLSFDGGGHTGSGSRAGGVDGKGGFPAILHPNETVVDHTRGQSGGGGGSMDVRVFVDNGGNWQAAVENISGKIAATVSTAVVNQNNRAVAQANRR